MNIEKEKGNEAANTPTMNPLNMEKEKGNEAANAFTMNPLACIGIMERYMEYFLATCVVPLQSEISPYLERAQWICNRLDHPLIKKRFITGSFGRDTTIRPLNDVDIFAVIDNPEPITESDSKVFFTNIVEVLSVGGYVVEIPGQVALWQVFLPPDTKFLLRKQRVSVGVCFTEQPCWDADSITCDIVPAFETDREDTFHIQTPASGLQITQPVNSMLVLNKMDKQWNGVLRSLIRLFKYWNQRNRVIVKSNETGIKMLQSFMIETQIMEFASRCSRPMELLSALSMAFSYVSSSLLQDAAVVIPGWEDAFLHHQSIKAVTEGISLQSISARLHACGVHCDATARALSSGHLYGALASLREVFGDDIVKHFLRYLNAAHHSGLMALPPSSEGDDMTSESVLRAVSVAAYRSDMESLRSLLSREQVTGSTQLGEIAPHSAAVLGGHLDVLQELVKHGYDVNSCEGYANFPPLDVAAREGHLEIAKWLLESAKADPNYGYPLDLAITRGSLPMVQLLVTAGANPNGIMALSLSIEQEQDEIFTWLLNNGADADYTSKHSSRTPLHIASIVGNVKAVCLLLEAGADPNHSDGEDTPLISAISKSHTEIALKLIDKSADVNACLAGGLAPLQVAASMKLDRVVSSLLERRASILPRNPTRPSRSFTGAKLQCSLSRAILSGAVDAVRALLNFGYDPNGYGYESSPLFHAVYAQSIECVKILLECKGVDINRANPSTGRTALHIAATRGEEFVSLLLKSNANPNVFDLNGATPLHAYADVGNVACARHLLNNGAVVNLNPSPLLMASMQGHTELVKVLLEHKADVNFAEPIAQKTALHLAAINGHVEVTTLLLKCGARHGDIMSEGSTPLHCAAFCGHAAVASLLIEARSNVNKPSTENEGSGQTPLMICVMMGYTHIMKLLLHGAAESIDVTDESGESPLFTACRLGFKDIVEILLENGANLNAMTPKGSTAFATAAIHGRSDICELLYKCDPSSCNPVLGDDRESCLLLALSLKHKDLSEKLVHWSSLETLQRKNAAGHTPALFAVKNGYLSVLNVLHDRLQFKTEEILRPLIFAACFFGHSKVYLALMQMRCVSEGFEQGPRWWLEREGMNDVDLFQRFLMHIDDGEIEAIKWYLKEGLANVNATRDNQLPIIRALIANHPEVVRLLISHGSVLEMKVNQMTLPTMALIYSQWEVLYHLVASGKCDIGQTLSLIVEERLAKGMDVLKRARPDLDIIETFRHSHLGVMCDECNAEAFTSTRHNHIKENVDYCHECYQKLLSQDHLDVNLYKVVDPPSWFVKWRSWRFFSFYQFEEQVKQIERPH